MLKNVTLMGGRVLNKLATEMTKLNDKVSHSGTVYFWNDRNFYFGPALTSDLQFAYCVKLYLATKGTFEMRSARGQWRTYQAALLPIGTTHEMRGNGATVASLRWAPHTLTAQRLMSVLVRDEIAKVPGELAEKILPRLRTYVDGPCGADDAVEVLADVERSVSSLGNFQHFDARIMQVLEQVRFDPDAVPTTAAAARSVKLSLGRFVHLFQGQTGLTFRRYLLGQRLQRALVMLPSTKSLTEVAHQAGFADASHFSRTTHMILGCAPTTLRSHRWFIQN